MSNFTAARFRLTLVMLIFVFPLVTAISYLIGPLTEHWTIWQHSLLLAPMMVICIVFFITPIVNHHFSHFIAGTRKQKH